MPREVRDESIVEACIGVASLLPEATLLIERDGTVRGANRAVERFLGKRSDELVDRRLHALVEETEAKVDEALRDWARAGSFVPRKLSVASNGGQRALRVEGARLAVGDSAAPYLVLRIADLGASIETFTLLNRRINDLTEEVFRRKRAEAMLEGQRKVFEMMARGQSLAVVLENIVLLAESLLDGALGSILILDSEKRLRLGAAPRLPDAYNQAIDGVEIGPAVGSCGTATYLRKPVIVSDIARDPLWADYRDLALEHELRACWSYPVLSANGEVLGSVAMYYQQAKAPSRHDEEITEIARYLAGIAIDRWRAEQTLHQRAVQLADADRRKNEFLAMLAHELRNPLASLVTTLELLRQPADVHNREGRIELLERQGRHLTRIVDDLLDVARISRGKIDLRRETVDLSRVVRHVYDSHRAAAAASGLELELELADGLWVEGDEDRLLQVLGNLMANALKYTPAGGEIRLNATADEGEAVIVVADDGEGIDPAILPTIFEPFAQGVRSLERQQGGLGIGLTLAKSLVVGHGGSLEAQSAGAGEGSEFTLRLPLHRPPSETASRNGERTAVVTRRDEASLRILLVEDNLDSADALSTLLEIWGHECRVANDGGSALAAAEQFAPQLVLMDIGLPEIDGYEVARRMRAHERFGRDRCVIIALTGYGQASDRQRALDAGFDQHLIKPVDPGRLKRMLDEFVS